MCAPKNVLVRVQVTWDPVSAFDIEDDSIFPMVAAGGDKISDVLLTGAKPEYMLKMIPLQIHWHETSEHSVAGMLVRHRPHRVCCDQLLHSSSIDVDVFDAQLLPQWR